MGKWLSNKIGVRGVLWINRGISVAVLGIAGWVCWTAGRTDGLVEATDLVEKTLNEK